MFNKIFFQYHVVSRMVTILSRKSKSLRLLYFKNVPSTDENFVTLKYRFSNAVFYQIGNIKTTSRSICIQKTDTYHPVTLTVYGYFRKNEYIINIKNNEAYLTRVVHNLPVIATQETGEFPRVLVPSA